MMPVKLELKNQYVGKAMGITANDVPLLNAALVCESTVESFVMPVLQLIPLMMMRPLSSSHIELQHNIQ
ncbi:hypothetical protein GWD52_06385 [Enterobacteriaceae bacterium 4M9]|nr:hypothetical protein [Enterobacteriaceae bacterium 4M9]